MAVDLSLYDKDGLVAENTAATEDDFRLKWKNFTLAVRLKTRDYPERGPWIASAAGTLPGCPVCGSTIPVSTAYSLPVEE
jgi:hypothetical protein